jgi:hypothetical protein
MPPAKGWLKIGTRILLLAAMIMAASGLLQPDCWAKAINVPGDQPSIQSGINAASNGDTFEVAPGTYFENINFKGKLITVTARGGAGVTTIDGHRANAVVTFSSHETPAAVLSGFTIRNGWALGGALGIAANGGGIFIQLSSPTILGNVITANSACAGGGGIALQYSSAIIRSNTITANGQLPCTGGGGGGIAIGPSGSAQIVSNVISNNSWSAGFGGGINVFAGASPLIKDNIISANSVTGVYGGCFEGPSALGGGVCVSDFSVPKLIQNLITNNAADIGGGVALSMAPGLKGPFLVNNTIVNNSITQPQGSAVYVISPDSGPELFNNLLIGGVGENAVYCQTSCTSNSVAPVISNNDAFSNAGSAFIGSCGGSAGKSGNISVQPLFVDATADNFRLLAGSPGIDAGLNSAPHLPPTDLAGLPRIVDGTGDGKFIIDMGAYEFQPVTISPTSIDFGIQPVGSHTSRHIVLTNHQKSGLAISNISAGGEFSAASSCQAVLAAGTGCTISVSFSPTAVGPAVATLTVQDSDTNGPRLVPLSGIGVSPGTPVILSIPHTVLVGSSFVLNGIGFTAGSRVNFFVSTATGPVNAGPFTPTSETASQLTVSVPDTVSLGQGFVSVQVVNTDTGFKQSNQAYALLQGGLSSELPTITGINGMPLAATSSDPHYAVNNVETVVVPGTTVHLGGTGFDTVNGVAIDLFCACPGGKIGPFLVNPGSPGLSPSMLTFSLPVIDPPASATGPGSFVVANKGAAGTYTKNSNAVSLAFGSRI